MSEIILTGLPGSHPLGALAAFGLLRCCQEISELAGARLSWRRMGDWFAVLHTDDADETKLIEALVHRQQTRPSAPELNWTDDIKTTRENFREAVQEADGGLLQGDRTYSDFLASFVCELATVSKGRLAPTAFYMTSGRQQFLKEVRGLSSSLATGVRIGRQQKMCQEMFREALFGPWKYEDPQHSLGWDPATERLHALQAKSPTKEPNSGITAAIWLAFESLPFFPCFYCSDGMRTVGFAKDVSTFLTWPMWNHPVSLDTLRSLLTLPELAQEKPPRSALRARGIEAVFRSEKYKVKSQGNYFVLRNAFPCF